MKCEHKDNISQGINKSTEINSITAQAHQWANADTEFRK